MNDNDAVTGPATHPETGGEIWHYEWNGMLWCEREYEVLEFPDEPVACPHCEEHIPVEI